MKSMKFHLLIKRERRFLTFSQNFCYTNEDKVMLVNNSSMKWGKV
jgi:hypothetical protein